MGARTLYRLDKHGRPLVRENALGATLAYQWDKAGRLTRLTNENGAHTHFDYDSRDRLIEETGFNGKASRYRHNRAGELTEKQEAAAHALPRRTVYERDPAGSPASSPAWAGRRRSPTTATTPWAGSCWPRTSKAASNSPTMIRAPRRFFPEARPSLRR